MWSSPTRYLLFCLVRSNPIVSAITKKNLILSAKDSSTAGTSLLSESAQDNRRESSSEDTSSNSAKETVPSSVSQYMDQDGEGEKVSVADNNLPISHESVDFSEPDGNMTLSGASRADLSVVRQKDLNSATESSILQEVSQANEQNSINKHVEESPKGGDEIYNISKITNGDKKLTEQDSFDRSPDNGLDYVSRASNSTHGNKGSISSSDDRHVNHNCYWPKSRRTFKDRVEKDKGNKKDVLLAQNTNAEHEARSLSSNSSNETGDSDVMRIFNALKDEISSKYKMKGLEAAFSSSTELGSINSSMELEKEGPSRYLNEGLAMKSDWKTDEELLRKIDELEYQLAEFLRRKDTKVPHVSDFSGMQHVEYKARINAYHHSPRSSYSHEMQHLEHQLKINMCRHSRRSSYGQPSSITRQYPYRQMSFSEKPPCSCLPCQEKQKQMLVHGSGLPCQSPDTISLQNHSLHLEKAHIKEKMRRHFRPISGFAPFMVCNICMALLHLPTDLIISRRKHHKVQCGACNEVLMFPLVSGRPDIIPKTLNEAMEEADDTTENQAEQLRNSFAEVIEKDEGLVQLHRLMGYDSARQLLYEHVDIDRVHYSPELPLHHSPKPSDKKPVSSARGKNTPRHERTGSTSSLDSVDAHKEDGSKKRWWQRRAR